MHVAAEELFNIKVGINAEVFWYIFGSVMRDKLCFVVAICFSEIIAKVYKHTWQYFSEADVGRGIQKPYSGELWDLWFWTDGRGNAGNDCIRPEREVCCLLRTADAVCGAENAEIQDILMRRPDTPWWISWRSTARMVCVLLSRIGWKLRQKTNKINRLHFTGMWSVF